jgi:hypothetical protein
MEQTGTRSVFRAVHVQRLSGGVLPHNPSPQWCLLLHVTFPCTPFSTESPRCGSFVETYPIMVRGVLLHVEALWHVHSQFFVLFVFDAFHRTLLSYAKNDH